MGQTIYYINQTIIQLALGIYLLINPKHITMKLFKNEEKATKNTIFARIGGVILILNCAITVKELFR